MAFSKVAMQPGMPQGCGVLTRPEGSGERRVPIITLPGNPVSTFVSFEVFVRPALAGLTGCTDPRPEAIATVSQGWRSPADRNASTPGFVMRSARTARRSWPVGGQLAS